MELPMGSMEQLDVRLRECLRELGIDRLTELQERSIPSISKGKSVLLIAPTGVGKTEAAVLPLFQKILSDKPEKISLIYITPLRALNRDMLRRMRFFEERLGIEVAVRHGDTSKKERARQTRHPPDVLITTPETLQIMFTGRILRSHLKNVRWVVVDEIHELAEDERGGQLVIGLERLASLCGRDFQRIGLSATVGNDKEVANYLGGVGREVQVIRVEIPKGMRIFVESPAKKKTDEKLAEQLHVVEDIAPAIRRCKALIEQHVSTLFFVNTRDNAEFLTSRLKLWQEDLLIGVHHGSLSKNIRIQMEDEFKNGILRSLVCTSSLELGIDVGNADFVLQYNSPRQVGRLIQRIGRSGHGVGEVSDGTIIAADGDDFAEACVIARKSLAGELEDVEVREGDLCVLANQIIAFTMTSSRNDVDESYKTIRRSYPFRNLKKTLFLDVLRQLDDLRTIRLRGDAFYRSRGSTDYFYENISMIPDEKTYRVIDISSRRPIGTLDESFVASYAETGTTFIMRGITWIIVELKEDRILVDRFGKVGTIPSWVGEEIPVPFAVAMEVGALRRKASFEEYNCDENGKREFKKYLKSQKDFPVPTDKSVIIESAGDEMVINACFGSKPNETLGRLISAMLSAKLGESVGMHSDPYRIIIQLPRKIDPKTVKEILETTDPNVLEGFMKIVLRNSTQLRWHFLYSAKKFGAVRRGLDYRQINVRRLMGAFEDTPLYQEAIDKMMWQRMDVRATAIVLRKIQKGDINVEVCHGLSSVSLAGYEKARELVAPRYADKQTLAALRKRVQKQEVVLACIKCKSTRRTRVKDAPDKVKCQICGSLMIASLHPFDRPLLKLLDKKDLTKDEKKELKKLLKNANLVREKGKKAIFALAGRGVGPDTAARIVARLHENEEEFLRDLLAAEVNYARTKRFWD
ncbi:MAG: DEAD/DEAH box helicase [Methanomassiliicoccales archaeon]|nr:MAG: DEAD/DEAH box helicase [Methanomassiliicoccales archaeon]